MEQFRTAPMTCLACHGTYDMSEERCPHCGRSEAQAQVVSRERQSRMNGHTHALLAYLVASVYYTIVSPGPRPHGFFYDRAAPAAMFVHRLLGDFIPITAVMLLGIWSTARSYRRALLWEPPPLNGTPAASASAASPSAPDTRPAENILRYYQFLAVVIAVVDTAALGVWTNRFGPFIPASTAVEVTVTVTSLVAVLLLAAGITGMGTRPVTPAFTGSETAISRQNPSRQATDEGRRAVQLWTSSEAACLIAGLGFVLTGSLIAGLVLLAANATFIIGGPYGSRLLL